MFNKFGKILLVAYLSVFITAVIGFALLITGIIWYGALNIWSFIF